MNKLFFISFAILIFAFVWNNETKKYSSAFNPAILFQRFPSSLTKSTEVTFEFDGADFNAFMCQIDDGPYSQCQSPVTYTGLTTAPHSFRVRGRYPNKMMSAPYQFDWTIDAAAPELVEFSRDVEDITKSREVTFYFRFKDFGSSVAAFECSLNGSQFSPCSSPIGFGSLLPGIQTFNVRASDMAGNVSKFTTSVWQIDGESKKLSKRNENLSRMPASFIPQ